VETIIIDPTEIKTAKGLMGVLLNICVQSLAGGKLDNEGVGVSEFFANEFRERMGIGGSKDAGKRDVAITEVEAQKPKATTVLEDKPADPSGKEDLAKAIETTAKRRRPAFVSRFGAIKITPVYDTRDIDIVLGLAQESMDAHVESDMDSEDIVRETMALGNIMSSTFRAVIHRF
jgi:hypothetical protein